jgi:hypothetical protein
MMRPYMLFIALLIVGCARRHEGGTPPSTTSTGSVAQATDTARGIVAVTGTDRSMHVVLRQSDGKSIELAGPDRDAVGRASGADVWVTGALDTRGVLTIRQFAVRSVDGEPSIDGVLASEGGRLVLVTPDGARHAIAHAPAALLDHVGARVWITNIERGPVAFGVLREKR